MNKIIIYHGSNKTIKQPIYHQGNPYNDYGYGFYCTKDIELAKEWSSGNSYNPLIKGIVNEYEIDLDGLNILNLENYNILYWITLLITNRKFDINYPIQKISKDYLIKNFYIDASKYDVIIGYRADDSYFSIARAFLSNTISLRQLEKALKLGKLGLQIVIVSKKAFNKIRFVNSIEIDTNTYYKKRIKRDNKAKEDFFNIISKEFNENDIFLMDIIRKDNN